MFVIDAEDRERLGEGWEVFGTHTFPHFHLHSPADARYATLDSVLTAPQILGVPLLLLANKQDSSNSLSVEEIRTDYEEWYRNKQESSRRRYGEDGENMSHRQERIASLDVMGVSALEGYVEVCYSSFLTSC